MLIATQQLLRHRKGFLGGLPGGVVQQAPHELHLPLVNIALASAQKYLPAMITSLAGRGPSLRPQRPWLQHASGPRPGTPLLAGRHGLQRAPEARPRYWPERRAARWRVVGSRVVASKEAGAHVEEAEAWEAEPEFGPAFEATLRMLDWASLAAQVRAEALTDNRGGGAAGRRSTRAAAAQTAQALANRHRPAGSCCRASRIICPTCRWRHSRKPSSGSRRAWRCGRRASRPPARRCCRYGGPGCRCCVAGAAGALALPT